MRKSRTLKPGCVAYFVHLNRYFVQQAEEGLAEFGEKQYLCIVQKIKHYEAVDEDSFWEECGECGSNCEPLPGFIDFDLILLMLDKNVFI